MKKYIQQIIKYKAEWMSFMNESVKHIFVAIYGMFSFLCETKATMEKYISDMSFGFISQNKIIRFLRHDCNQ